MDTLSNSISFPEYSYLCARVDQRVFNAIVLDSGAELLASLSSVSSPASSMIWSSSLLPLRRFNLGCSDPESERESSSGVVALRFPSLTEPTTSQF